MQRILNFFFITILLAGCGGESDSSGGSGGSSIVSLTVIAERLLTHSFEVPFSVNWGYSPDLITKPKHQKGIYIDHDKKEFRYVPANGFIGEDSFKLKFDDKNSNSFIVKEYKINVVKTPLEGGRDFVISSVCEDYHKQALSFDIDIVDDSQNVLEKVYDDYKSVGRTLPQYSRIQLDYTIADNSHGSYERSKKHHESFKRHISDNILITCNYPRGYKRIFLPIKNNISWLANTKHLTGGDGNKKYARNDLYFYTSFLSELHNKIYLKEYEYSGDFDASFEKANIFMSSVFPASHYSAELARSYKTYPSDPIISDQTQLYTQFENDNKDTNNLLSAMADEISDKNIFKLIDMIAENYKSYYLSGNKECTSATLCAKYFPEYTSSVTINSDFSSGTNGWDLDEEIYDLATGRSQYNSSADTVSLELRASVPSYSGQPVSFIGLSQTKLLANSNIDDYLFHFDLANILGAADGGPAFSMCISSSGFTGAYVVLRDVDDNQLGLLAWTDHCNKFDYSWINRNGIDSTEKFHNVRLREVVRRVNPSVQRFEYIASIGEMIKEHLSKVYDEKNKINSIEYGLFVTEHRSKTGQCFFCDAKIKAHMVNLLIKSK